MGFIGWLEEGAICGVGLLWLIECCVVVRGSVMCQWGDPGVEAGNGQGCGGYGELLNEKKTKSKWLKRKRSFFSIKMSCKNGFTFNWVLYRAYIYAVLE